MDYKLLFFIILYIGYVQHITYAKDTKPTTSLCIGYMNNTVDGYWGTDNKAHVSIAIRLTTSMMNGNQLLALKCAIGALDKVTDCKIFIKKELSKDENLYEQEFIPIYGWNYIYLDYPFSLIGLNEFYIGYEMTSTGDFIGYERKTEYQEGADFIRLNNNEWTNLSILSKESVIHSMAAIVTEGKYASYDQNCVDLQNAIVPTVVKADTIFNLKGNLINRGVRTLQSFDICCKINDGEEVRYPQNVNLLNQESTPFSFPIEVPKGKNTISIRLDRANGKSEKIYFDKVYIVDAYQKAFPHMTLIEYFTSQGCANCPAGKKVLDKAIKEYKHQTATISHHAGYTEDLFTIPESLKLTQLWNINSAPTMMIDRSTININGMESLAFHPAYITSDIVRDHSLDASLVGIKIDNSFYKGDSILAVKVRVEKDPSFLKPVKLHVYLCENGYVAYQGSTSGGSSEYIHDHFPRKILSELEGDDLLYNGDTDSENTYYYKVPAKYEVYSKKSTIASCPEKMEIVTFVAEFDEASSSYSVYNAATQPLNFTEGTSINSCAEEAASSFRIGTEAGNLSIKGEFETAWVYTLSGVPVGILTKDKPTVGLSDGFYIVKVITGRGVRSRKIAFYQD